MSAHFIPGESDQPLDQQLAALLRRPVQIIARDAVGR